MMAARPLDRGGSRPGPVRAAARWLAAAPIVVLGSLAAIIVGVASRPTGLRIGIAANRVVLRLLGVSVVVENANTGPLTGCVFVLLNHASMLDATIVSTAVPPPFRAIAAIEYALIPFFGWPAWLFAWVIVRQWPEQARRALRRVRCYVQNGGNLLISIEGRVSPDGSLSPYKKGAVVVATEAGARIVPVVLHGARDRLPLGEWRVRPGTVRVSLLAAIDTAATTVGDRDRLLARLRSRAEEALASGSRPKAAS